MLPRRAVDLLNSLATTVSLSDAMTCARSIGQMRSARRPESLDRLPLSPSDHKHRRKASINRSASALVL